MDFRTKGVMIWVSGVFRYGSCGFLCSPSRGAFKASSVLQSLTVYQLPHSGNRLSCLLPRTYPCLFVSPVLSPLIRLTCSAISWPLLIKFTKPAYKLIPGEGNHSPAGPPSQHHSWISFQTPRHSGRRSLRHPPWSLSHIFQRMNPCPKGEIRPLIEWNH